MIGVAPLLTTTTTQAQTCQDTINTDRLSGRAVVAISSPCRTAKEPFAMSYSLTESGPSLTVLGHFDSMKMAVMPISLFRLSTPLTIKLKGTLPRTLPLAFANPEQPEYRRTGKLAIIWNGNLDLALRIVGRGSVYADANVLGKSEIDSDWTEDGDHIQSFAIQPEQTAQHLVAYAVLNDNRAGAGGCHPAPHGTVLIRPVLLSGGKTRILPPTKVTVNDKSAWICPAAGKPIDPVAFKKVADFVVPADPLVAPPDMQHLMVLPPDMTHLGVTRIATAPPPPSPPTTEPGVAPSTSPTPRPVTSAATELGLPAPPASPAAVVEKRPETSIVQVVNGKTGGPLAGVKIGFDGVPDAPAWSTDENGRAVIRGVDGQTKTIKLQATGFADSTVPVPCCGQAALVVKLTPSECDPNEEQGGTCCSKARKELGLCQ